MHLKPKYINNIINILLGVAWASAFYGFLYGLFTTRGNLLTKLASGVIDLLFGLFFVLLIELIYIQFKKYEEQRKTNRLLQELLEKKFD